MEKVMASTMTDLECVTALNSPPPPLSPISEKSINNKHQEEFAASFASLYNSVFSPESQLPSSLSLSPSPPSSSSPLARIDEFTEDRLRQTRLILEYDELNEHYELCLNRIESLVTEIDSLRQENDALRHENSDLLKLIHISTSSSSSFSPPLIRNRQQISDNKHSRSTRTNNPGRNLLPKSISVRSPGYLKIKQGISHGCSGDVNRQTSQHSVTSQLGFSQVASQGMMKTELCNKWQETNACPYGDYCQFAHGIDDLRPVIRHPRYKTDVCRMIITGATCPYGHRCHFRHSLTDQERMILLTR